MLSLARDVKFAIRHLLKSPGFAATAVLMLALGIGATTAIFSVVEGVLLRPLPFANPARLVLLGDHLQGTNWGEKGAAPVTAPEIRTYMRETQAFQSLGGFGSAAYELSGVGEPAQVNAARMSAAVFPTLGVAPLLGRTFTSEEDEQCQPVAILSYTTWKDRFQGNPRILGTKILLDRKPYLVIGVMPQSFEFPLLPGRLNRSEMWVPMSLTEHELSGDSDWKYEMVGRLKPGVTAAQAQGDAERVAQQIMHGSLAANASLRINALVTSLQEITIGQARPLVQTLFLAVAVVLLIACANLTGLLLVRAIRKQREIAVRLALGASSGVLLRQAMLESLLLSVSGGLLGVTLAAPALHIGKSLLPESLPRISEIGLNWSVAGFALLLAVLTGLLCGLAPAFAMLRTNVNGSLKEGGRSNSGSGGHARLRSGLVVLEVAVAMVLVTASGLLLRSFEKMSAADLGFHSEHVVTASYALPQKQYASQSTVDTFNNELLLRLQQLPGSVAAGLTNNLPVSGGAGIQAFVPDGYVFPKGTGMNAANRSYVTNGFFRSLDVPLLHGRFFSDSDRATTQLVAIVNHKFAEHYWPGLDPVGKRIRNGTQEFKTPWMTIVGEVTDVKLGSPDGDASEQFYQPLKQLAASYGSLPSPEDLIGTGQYVTLRSAQSPAQMENAMRAIVHALDPQLALTQVQTMEQVVSDSEAPRWFNTVLISGFAGIAVLLAVLGIYSVTAFSVALRSQEMAIRMALGAQRAGVMRLILYSAAKLAAAGCAIGLVVTAAASHLLRSLLFGVDALDPGVLAVAVTAMLLVSLAASLLPAHRASTIDPMEALRSE